jgi:hypothetical protein
MKLSTPAPRKSRKAAAVAKVIGRPDGVERWIGSRVNGSYWIEATNGSRALLATAGNPDARQVGFSLGQDSFVVADPEFFNAVKRARVLSTEDCIRFTVSGSSLILHSGPEVGAYSTGEESTEVFDIVPNGHTRDGFFKLNAKWLLESLGNWPMTVTYDAADPMTPILFEFPNFAYLQACIKPGRRAKTTASRLGTPSSGLTAHIRGWDIGVQVDCRAVDEVDVIEVFATSGSNGYGRDQHIATITLQGDHPRVVHHLKEGE